MIRMKMDTLRDFTLLMIYVIVITSGEAWNLERTALGVKFTHKGYLTATSSHYIHTV